MRQLHFATEFVHFNAAFCHQKNPCSFDHLLHLQRARFLMTLSSQAPKRTHRPV